MGRPKKVNAIKSGELGEGLQRFSFIADANIIDSIKKSAKSQNLSIKNLMLKILSNYLKESTNLKTTDAPIKRKSTVPNEIPKNENEARLLKLLAKRENDKEFN